MNSTAIVMVLLETGDELWTEVARGRTEEEILGQLREDFLRDDEPVVITFHVGGKKSDEFPNGELTLINPTTLEEVAQAAITELNEPPTPNAAR